MTKKYNHILTIMLIIGVIIFVIGQFALPLLSWIGLFIALIPIALMVVFSVINLYKLLFK